MSSHASFVSARRLRLTAGVGAAAIAALALAGCSSPAQPDAQAPTSADETCDAAVTVAYLPVGSAAAVVLGVEKGVFEEEGLDVTLVETPAPSLQPSVVSGESQFAFTSAPAVLATASNGLPVQVVGAASGLPAAGEPSNIALVAPEDGEVQGPEDLVGKTVAVDALFQLPHITLLQALENAGVDASEVTVVEVAYPAMTESIERGQIDAAVVSDGFLLGALSSGYAEVLPNNAAAGEDEVAAIWITSEAFAKDSPEIVSCFQRGLAAANEYAASHEDEVREILPTYTAIEPAVAAELRLPSFSATVSPDVFAQYEQVMLDNGAIDNEVDLDRLLLTGE